MKNLIIAFISIFLLSSFSIAQSGVEINDLSYKFKFTLPSGWSERLLEETSKKDAISYAFDKDDGKIAIMLLAFKVNEVKNLSDFVYTLEKDLTLNIPKIDGEYLDYDLGNLDGISAKYKDTEFTEIIYYYRSKIIDAQNFTYMLRFITPTSNFDSVVENEIKALSENFKPDY